MEKGKKSPFSWGVVAILLDNGNEKGFVLIESLIALTIVTIALAVSSSSSLQLLERMQKEKVQTELYRVLQDQARVIKEQNSVLQIVKSNQYFFQVEEIEEGERRGVRVHHGDETTEISLLEIPKK